MHYAKRIARAHRTLRNRLRVLRSLIDDWPLDEQGAESDGDAQEEGATDLTREDLAAAVDRWKEQVGVLANAAMLGESPSARGEAAAEAAALRDRIDRLKRGLTALDETGKRSVRAAILKMFREKFRIERYSQWHARSKGLNPICRHP